MNEIQLAFEDTSYEGAGKIYVYKNKLWRLAKVSDICAPNVEQSYPSALDALIYWRERSSWFFPRGWRDGEHPDRKHMLSVARKDTAQYLLVDSVLYKQIAEPLYVVQTFGLGNNHGGTGLFVDYGRNPNISKDWYFSALDGDKAVEFANHVAKERGDTNDIGRFRPWIKVYMPELVKYKTKRKDFLYESAHHDSI